MVVPVAHDIPCVAAAKDDTASEVKVHAHAHAHEMALLLPLRARPPGTFTTTHNLCQLQIRSYKRCMQRFYRAQKVSQEVVPRGRVKLGAFCYAL